MRVHLLPILTLSPASAAMKSWLCACSLSAWILYQQDSCHSAAFAPSSDNGAGPHSCIFSPKTKACLPSGDVPHWGPSTAIGISPEMPGQNRANSSQGRTSAQSQPPAEKKRWHMGEGTDLWALSLSSNSSRKPPGAPILKHSSPLHTLQKCKTVQGKELVIQEEKQEVLISKYCLIHIAYSHCLYSG